MISIGRERFLLRNLNSDNVQALLIAHKAGILHENFVSRDLLASLMKIGATKSRFDLISARRYGRRHQLVIPSSVVARVCRIFSLLAANVGLLVLLLLSLAGTMVALKGGLRLIPITTWFMAANSVSILATATIFLLCIFVHELGHGAACLRRAGLVGAISIRFSGGMPIFLTDVSTVHRLSHKDKAAVAASGVIFQVAFSVALLLSPYEVAHVAATFSLMSAAFAMVPLPGSDGYWFISDYFKATLVGWFGPHGRADCIGALYTAFLVLTTSYLFYVLSRECFVLLTSGLGRLEDRPCGGLALMLLSGYSIVVALFFVKRQISFLRAGSPRHA